MSVKIITTEDGSHSLFDDVLNETYHSTRGARGESEHVFIKEGLDHWFNSNDRNEAQILEVGLGTGLNVFLTALYTDKYAKKVSITSLEPYPIEREIYQQLNFHTSEEEKKLLQDIHNSGWEESISLSKHCDFLKSKSSLEAFESKKKFDIIYFDAFAPSKQPEVWSLDNIKKCNEALSTGGILTTYCAQGQFKRNLKEAGFEVETLKGAMGKKEMVRAFK